MEFNKAVARESAYAKADSERNTRVASSSKDSPLGVLLIRFFHEKSGHSGREYVLALLRERFWLIRGNTTARSVLSSCFQCKRRHGPAGEQKMADLPRPRVTPDQPPFTCIGIDYFGPFLVRQRRSLVKRYGAISHIWL